MFGTSHEILNKIIEKCLRAEGFVKFAKESFLKVDISVPNSVYDVLVNFTKLSFSNKS